MLFRAWLSTSRSPMERASSTARRPQSRVSGTRPASMASCALLLNAMASSWPAPNGSSVATARSAVPVGVRTASEEPGEPRHPALRCADRLRRRVRLLVELERQTAGVQGRVGLVGEVALVREAVVEDGGLLAAENLGEAQRQPVLARGLPVCAEAA